MNSGASLAKRSAILALTRIASQAILFFSPMVLVRLLSVAEYGKYREFILYGTLGVGVLGFLATASIPYFIPRHPDKSRIYTTQAVAFVLLSSIVGVAAIGFAGDFLRSRTSFDFVVALQAYIFFTLNFDFLEMYWLAHKRAASVLYYASTRLLARLAVITAAAAITGRAEDIVWALIMVEALRLAWVVWYSLRSSIFSFEFSRGTMLYQASYFLPLGAGAIIHLLNENIAKILVSSTAGVGVLAMYVTGAFALPIVNIVRGSISDAIFPEMAERVDVEGTDQLRLWRRATVAYASLLFPISGLFMLLAHEIIGVLFTRAYLPAAPVFAVFASLIIVKCFDFSLPLRLLNQNKLNLAAAILGLLINAAILVPAYRTLGAVGAALALVLSEAATTVFLGYQTNSRYGLMVATLAAWGSIGRIACAAVLSAVPVVVVKTTLSGDWAVLVVGTLMYGLTYLALTNILVLWDVASARKLIARLRQRRRQGARGAAGPQE